MATIEHALSILMPGMEYPGLFTGKLEITGRGEMIMETVHNADNEGAAFAAALRFDDEVIANATATTLARFMRPGGSIRRVEFVRAG